MYFWINREKADSTQVDSDSTNSMPYLQRCDYTHSTQTLAFDEKRMNYVCCCCFLQKRNQKDLPLPLKGDPLW